ncbi:MAG: methylated-DNA--[protein]-cysteine S-methyltransferase [Cytophagaceae bacterium]|nr:methylated-DNA--[protein]-cysteine S-methyltransferase [Cytophagaceae bacterium]MDW8456549.1 methylated-DNA--[protein]-cysteine S-methyltransferase [Cytophagaceae bacterium]
MIKIAANDDYITSVCFAENRVNVKQITNSLTEKTAEQLSAYFEGTLEKFSLELMPTGTAFQKYVWHHLNDIVYARTTSYIEVAKLTGSEKSARAVGTAIGKNPFLIVVPCHRVIRSDGQLGGYAAGVWRKKWLLEHEQKFEKATCRMRT